MGDLRRGGWGCAAGDGECRNGGGWGDGGMGVNRRVMLMCTVFSYIERVFGGERERMAIHL